MRSKGLCNAICIEMINRVFGVAVLARKMPTGSCSHAFATKNAMYDAHHANTKIFPKELRAKMICVRVVSLRYVRWPMVSLIRRTTSWSQKNSRTPIILLR